MPILIRIILQRLLILFYSFLAFLGIAPEASIPTEEQARIAIEERQQAIADFFNDEEVQENIDNTIQESKKLIEEVENLEINTDELERMIDNIEKTSESTTEQENYNSNRDVIRETIDKIRREQETKSTEVDYNNEKSNYSIEDIVVNIVCSRDGGSFVNVSTGSGVIIDPKGIIITNAHVGQFVLIEDQKLNSNMECAAYKENIPTFGYNLDILYISPDWIENNYTLLNSKNPRGTGEYDYALLYVSGSTNPTIRKPREFPYANLLMNESVYEKNEQVTVSGYPGAPKNIIDIARAGFLKKDNVLIEDVYTFGKQTIDIFSTTKSEVGARGASGGGVFKNGNLIGIISTTNGDQNDANINAITTTYISRDLQRNTGKTLKEIIKDDPIETILEFSDRHGGDLSNLLFDQM